MESLLMKRSDASSSAQKMLLEKDQQIAELLEEGSGHVIALCLCVRVCARIPVVSIALALAHNCSYGGTVAMVTVSLFRRETVEAATAVEQHHQEAARQGEGDRHTAQDAEREGRESEDRAREAQEDSRQQV